MSSVDAIMVSSVAVLSSERLNLCCVVAIMVGDGKQGGCPSCAQRDG